VANNVFWGVPGAIAAQANPTILAIGDSWFWYPMDNLAQEIGAALDQQTLVVVGRNGAEAAQWSDRYRKDIDVGFKFYGEGVQALLLSGGGNDIAGVSDLLRLLQDDCAKATDVAGCFRAGQPDAIIAKIIGAYRELILRFRARNTTAPVLTHNYDYAWPTGKGVFGPADWLKEPMDRAKVPKALRRDLFRALVDRLREAQLGLKKDKALGPVVALRSAGTMPDEPEGQERWWANELHPTPEGFRLQIGRASCRERVS
jgi:hypothetical protein